MGHAHLPVTRRAKRRAVRRLLKAADGHGMDAYTLADVLGVGRLAVQRWRNGVHVPRWPACDIIAAAQAIEESGPRAKVNTGTCPEDKGTCPEDNGHLGQEEDPEGYLARIVSAAVSRASTSLLVEELSRRISEVEDLRAGAEAPEHE